MSAEKRTRRYELRKRADAMEATRRRITEAAVELHGSVGPARTTITAVADRAGVQRQTVYRHFPTEDDLFTACSGHFAQTHPRPDVEAWRAIADPKQRLTTALGELYAYYERTEPMLANVLRDAELIDFARDAVAPLHAYLEEAADILAAGRRRRRLVAGALRHAVAFSTWRTLSANGIGRADAARLMTALVEGA
jgi:AcrR family transcriptional regulator